LRYRPSHSLDIGSKLHLYEIRPGEFYRGGLYGFVSSHAANFFAIVTAVWFVFKLNYSKIPWIVSGCGILILLSRVYLGVHYLSDTIVGAALGISIATLLFRLFYIPQRQKMNV
jgi:undecaprenyl-diphosphatase